MSAAFPQWVRGSVHENAPDHSVQTVEVGKLREASRTIEELYEALENCVSRLRKCALHAGNSDFAVDALCEQFEAPLRKARGEQA